MDKELVEEYDGKIIRILEVESEMAGEAARNEVLLEYLAIRGHKAVETTKIIRDLSVEIAHFIFRNGPVEGMHSGNHSLEHFTEIPHDTPLKDISQLSEKDMEILNKFMVDRIGYLLTLYQQAEYTKLRGILREMKKLI